MLKRKTPLRSKPTKNMNARKPLRRESRKRATAKAIWQGKEISVKLWRSKYLSEHWACEYPGCIALARDVHEIARGIYRKGALTEPAALLCLCRCHHEEVQTWSTVKQLALKKSVCPWEYDREKVNELRGRQPEAITESEVLEAMRGLVRCGEWKNS